MAVLLPLLFVTVTAFLAYSLWMHLKFRLRFSGIHSPRSYPLFGHMFIVKSDVQGFFDQFMGMADAYPTEPRMVAFWAGPAPILLLYAPELLEPIIANPKHLDKPFLYDMLKPWLGNGLLLAKTAEWRPHRKLLTPTFHYDILKNFVYVFNKQSEIMINQLRKVKENTVVSIGKYITLCALDIICETSMGRCVDAQLQAESDYVCAVQIINDIIQRRMRNPLLFNDVMFYLFGDQKNFQWALDVLHSFTKSVIEERRTELRKEGGTFTGERLAFLDQLLVMELSGKLSVQEVQAEVDTFMFEGHDTTATALMWAVHLLGNHPEVQEKAFLEIEAVMGDSEEVAFEHLSQLKYLECVIKESLRLLPSVPMFVRTLGEDQAIGGFNIPQGTQVAISPYLIHRDPKHWDSPEVFNPDRFLPDNTKNRHAFAFVPFSAGSRNCIGQRFALMEEKTVLAVLLRNYKIESCQRRDELAYKLELILRPIDDILVKLTPRSA